MPENLKFGKYTYGLETLKIYDYGFKDYQISIGSFTSISSDVRLYVSQGCGHFYNSGTNYPFGITSQSKLLFPKDKNSPHNFKGDIKIGNDVWIGDHVSISSGIHIGDGVVIGANSNVTKNVPPYAIVGGNPGKIIKYRFSLEIIEKFLELKWWDLEDNQIRSILPLLQSIPTIEIFDLIYEKLKRRY